MDTLDYDRALYYTHRSEWDNLIVLMVRTKDHMLSKRIERFLHAYQFSSDYTVIERNLYSLLRYLDHANNVTGIQQNENPVLSI
ncbi:YhdB family protein [Lederbergia citri]|uniref:YhdB family protein n=1 Tax=Lederbergia citri TaxID=2833580 RepID=A0A942YFD5_9BACI|nr:YhdB family protein [Lederbergia citri]MBS4193519.1 YhdB family protein [Lederbergia citri]